MKLIISSYSIMRGFLQIKLIWGVFLILLQTFPAFAQQQEDKEQVPATEGIVPIISPTAASLGKFVDVPVNMHTGIPNINIPVYTVKEGPLQLPISFSYHAGGLKVGEKSSWVGAGWALNAGGMVSRTIRGRPDERGNADGFSYLKDNGYFNYLIHENGLDLHAFAKGDKDGEPDLFFFNFGGYSGKFFLREDGKPVLIPHQDIKIEPFIQEGGSHFRLKSWTFTTPDGTKYYFGISDPGDNIPGALAVENAESITSKNQDGCYPRDYSSWYLYKVESADSQHSIKLSYTKEDYGYYSLALGQIDVASYDALVKNIMRGVRLDAITFTNGRVAFIPGSNREDLVSDYCTMDHNDNNRASPAKALGSIEVYENGTDFCKRFELNTSYFVDNTNSLKGAFASGVFPSMNLQTDRKRLKLNSITEMSCDGTEVKPATTFSYYDEDAVPRSLLFSVDHWGFNNGAVDNEWLVPALSLDGGKTFGSVKGMGMANRESSWPAMRAGTLQSISNPMGGVTEFIYGTDYLEGNVYTGEDEGWSIVETYSCGKNTEGGRCPDSPTEYLQELIIGSGEAYKIELSSTTGLSCSTTVYGSGVVRILDANGILYDEIKKEANGDIESKLLALPKGRLFYIEAEADPKPSQGPDCNPPWNAGIEIRLYKKQEDTQLYAVGGLRIEEVRQKDAINEQWLSTRYEYPSGVSLFSIPRYIFKVKNPSLAVLGLVINSIYTENGCAYYKLAGGKREMRHGTSTSSTHPMQTTQGNHKGYSTVKVIKPDNGYSLYEYDVSGTPFLPSYGGVSFKYIDVSECLEYDESYPTKPVENNFERSNLIAEKHFANDGFLLRETSYKTTYVKDTYGAHGLKVVSLPSLLEKVYLPVEYQTRSSKKVSEKRIEKIYEPESGQSNPIVRSYETHYDDEFHTNPTVSTTYDGEIEYGRKLEETIWTYIKDLDPCTKSCPDCEDNLNVEIEAARLNYEKHIELADNNNLSKCNELHACGGFAESCTDADTYKLCAYTNFEWEINEARKKYVSCLLSCTQDAGCLDDAFLNGNLQFKAIISLIQQNQLQKPVEVSQWKNNKLLTSNYYEYEVTDDVTRDVYPLNTFKINTKRPLTQNEFTPVYVSNGTVKQDAAYKLETTYRYEDGNIVEFVGRDGVFTSFIWDSEQKLPIVKATGVRYDNLLEAYNAAVGQSNFEELLRKHSNLQKAQVTTYTHHPLVGLLTQTEPNGQTIKYYYDKLGRFSYVQDHEGNILKQYQYNYRVK